MGGYDPSTADETAAQQAKLRRQKLARLKAEGMRPSTPPAVVDKMLEVLDPGDLTGTLTTIKTRWPQHFGAPRSADKLAAQALRR